jgi:plastocyanin
VSIAGLAAELVLEMGARGASQKNFVVSEQQKPEPMEVKIDNFSFGPGTLTAPVGTTVTWTNRDDIPHTVVSTDGLFKSKVLDTDEKFSYTFSKAGTYPYFCSIHPKMTGKVAVRSESGAIRNPFDIRAALLAKHAQHGVLTHFPIALFIAGVAFDFLAEWTRRATYARAA